MLRFADQGPEKLNWAMNRQILENEMKQGKVIYETYVESNGTQRFADPASFLGRERQLLTDHGWRYVPGIRGWVPPGFF